MSEPSHRKRRKHKKNHKSDDKDTVPDLEKELLVKHFCEQIEISDTSLRADNCVISGSYLVVVGNNNLFLKLKHSSVHGDNNVIRNAKDVDLYGLSNKWDGTDVRVMYSKVKIPRRYTLEEGDSLSSE